jgi:hypothetical protein
MRHIEPVVNGRIDQERVVVLQEIITTCFQPATVKGAGVHRIKAIEESLGYVSRIAINYIFGTLGYLNEDTTRELEIVLLDKEHPTNPDLYQLPIKAKMSIKLLRLIGTVDRDVWKLIDTIETHTGITLHKTRTYVKKYEDSSIIRPSDPTVKVET